MSWTPCNAVADHQGATDPRLKTPAVAQSQKGSSSTNTKGRPKTSLMQHCCKMLTYSLAVKRAITQIHTLMQTPSILHTHTHTHTHTHPSHVRSECAFQSINTPGYTLY